MSTTTKRGSLGETLELEKISERTDIMLSKPIETSSGEKIRVIQTNSNTIMMMPMSKTVPSLEYVEINGVGTASLGISEIIEIYKKAKDLLGGGSGGGQKCESKITQTTSANGTITTTITTSCAPA